ncbi:hypothetical protein LTR84_005311 [Exophiala bonariae]|uniref:Decapping nuclease n=1 Tax=Exophiala bonariae TaxID=1690606 RepID=A0AAV9N3G9_9EURO|nr:hypothetical protein LTR84_005311 [Exophiala bonariae]
MEEPEPQAPSPPLGELLIELAPEDISHSTHNPQIKDCVYVASYSWLDAKGPTVIIPGQPPAWAPPSVNRRLDPDKGKFFRDLNAARYPSYPMEPAVQALFKQHAQFPTKDIDIVCCTSALGNLSRFARGVEKDFRIILVRVGNTVFFIRRENSPTELIPNVRGYGHAFLEEYTMWEKHVKGSKSHQRVIQYDFGGLRLLVRFETDGYFRGEVKRSDPQLKESFLVEALDRASVGDLRTKVHECLHDEEGGQAITQESIFDIKTRSAFDFETRRVKKEIDMTDIISRLWISQIPTLIVGFHDRGLFEDIRIKDMRTEIREWEAENTENLCKLASLLYELVESARTSRTNLEICRRGSGPLEVRRLADEGFEALPPELKIRWVGEPEESEETSPEDGGSLNSEDGSGKHIASALAIDIRARGTDSDDESVKDYTACSLEGCGYCGHCPY